MRGSALLFLWGITLLWACNPVSPPDDPSLGGNGMDTTATDPGYPYLFSVTLAPNFDPNTRAFFLAYDPSTHDLLGWAEAVPGEAVAVAVPNGYEEVVDLVSVWITDDGTATHPTISVLDRRRVLRRGWSFGPDTFEEEYNEELGLRALYVEDNGSLDLAEGALYLSTRGRHQYRPNNATAPYLYQVPRVGRFLEGQTEHLLLNQFQSASDTYRYQWLELPGDNADTATVRASEWTEAPLLRVSPPASSLQATTILYGYPSTRQAFPFGYRLMAAANVDQDFIVPDLSREFEAFRHLTVWRTSDGISELSKEQSFYSTSQPYSLPGPKGSVSVLDSTFSRFFFHARGDKVVLGRGVFRTYEEGPSGEKNLVYSWTVEAPPGPFEYFNYQIPREITALSPYFRQDPNFFSLTALAYPSLIDYEAYQNARQADNNINTFANYELTTFRYIGTGLEPGLAEDLRSGGFQQ